MALHVIIPVKPFSEAKQRLAPALGAAQRLQLAQDFFRHVLATALGFSRPVIVVSRAPDVLALADAEGATALLETTRSGLNAALAEAENFARIRDASRLLVVASDLPLLKKSDLAALAAEECAIAPDRRRRGTNALLWPASPHLGFHFGEDSFERHFAAAKGAGFDPKIISRAGLAHDVDLPEDLLAL